LQSHRQYPKKSVLGANSVILTANLVAFEMVREMHYGKSFWVDRLPEKFGELMFVGSFFSLLVAPIVAAIFLSRYYLLWVLTFPVAYLYLLSVGH